MMFESCVVMNECVMMSVWCVLMSGKVRAG